MSTANDFLGWVHRRQMRGSNRLHRLLRSVTATSPLVCAKTRYGAKLLLDPYEYVDGFILRHGFYESEVFEALRPHLAGGGVFWDIGSNTGLHGVTAKYCFPSLDVVCFEPVPALANRILENARINDLSLAVFASALGAGSGSTWITVTPGNLGMSHVDHARSSDGPVLLTSIQSGDSLIEAGLLRPPSVVKIDAEGSEPAILHGMASALRSVKAIAFEAGADILDSPSHPIRQFLDREKFRYRQLIRAEPTAHNLENFIAER